MFEPKCYIQFLDFITEEFGYISLSDIFNHHWHLSCEEDNGKEVLTFSSARIKVRDWNGWTDLLRLIRIPIDISKDFKWCEFYNVDEKNLEIGNCLLRISSDSKITIYDIDSPIKKFHGHLEYKHSQENPYEYENKGYLRIYGKTDENGKHIDWIKYKIKPIQDKYLNRFWSSQYLIETRSGFCNINNIHLNVN